MHATYLAHLILLDYMAPTIPGKQHKPGSSSYAILQNRLSTATICNTVTSYLRGSDGDLLREGVVLGVDLGVEPADKSPGGRDSCLLRRVSFSSGTANNEQLTSELSVCAVPCSLLSISKQRTPQNKDDNVNERVLYTPHALLYLQSTQHPSAHAAERCHSSGALSQAWQLEALLQPRDSQNGICNGQSESWAHLSPSTAVFPCQYLSTIATDSSSAIHYFV